ncbi:MAG: ADP-ribosylglycohydrolase family protein [Bacteroidota bacterium]
MSDFLKITFLLGLTLFFSNACTPPPETPDPIMEVREDEEQLSDLPFLKISKDSLYNKVLGTLVGSAIGDAMGAPTEMWSRQQIKLEYGFVDSMDDMIREPSPEGTWDHNLAAGGTTDDTRWKVLLTNFMANHANELYREKGPDPFEFATFLVDRYQEEIDALKRTEAFDPEPFEAQMRRLSWLQEWAVVAKPYSERDLTGYMDALHRFYGGEMVCAGMLYAPMIGIPYPGAPDLAYQSAFDLAIFDLGYARDVTALTSALVAAALPYEASTLQVLSVLRSIDPQGYFKSRLVGRSTYRIFRDALSIVDQAKAVSGYQQVNFRITADRQDTLYLAQVHRAYELLDQKIQDFPFHAGEIHLINLVALLFSDFDFRKGLEFVVNYGRDNDTVAAVTGAILGAYHGFDKIPEDLKSPVLATNREKLGIDLELMANELSEMIIRQGAVE